MTLAPRKQVQPTELAALRARASSLAAFGSLLDDEIGSAYLNLLASLAERRLLEAESERARLFRLLATEAELYPEPLVGDAWQNHLLDRLLGEEGPFSLKAQRAPFAQLGSGLVAQAQRDLTLLQRLFALSGQALAELAEPGDGQEPEPLDWEGFNPLGADSPPHNLAAFRLKQRLAESVDWPTRAEDLARFYFEQGSGLFGRFRAFRWTRRGPGHQGHLEGIAHPDSIRLDDLIGYERERAALLENTEQFLAGFPANNVLLFGERGTGKSSTIKALLPAYGERGLRLVEVAKQNLADFPSILALLRGRRERFVLFVDDLSFDEHETIYKELKAVLEGSLEARPENVVVYATSNRRHLIVERFSDHDAPDEAEIHSMDTVQEKLSLSDRFGLRIFFLSPDQQRYLEIVRGLAARRNLPIGPEELERQALQWATWQNGRNGRTARQYVDHLTGKLRVGATASRPATSGR
jgi:predicted AAA+ superfamily ATPase